MSIQYAGGTIVNTTLTQVAGTRAELAQWIRDQLVAAGWTSSGSATDYQVTSALTPQNLQGRVRVYDSGAGNCARLKWSNPGGTKTQSGDLFLLPAAAKVWRIIANKYQFWVFASANTPREFACGGVPYLPSFLNGVVTEAIWGASNSNSDTDTTGKTNFRTSLSSNLTFQAGGVQNNAVTITNGNLTESNTTGSVAGYVGAIQLQAAAGGCTGNAVNAANFSRRWHDDRIQMIEPLISWGLTSMQGDEAKIRGQLWDAVVLSDAFTVDQNLTIDGRTYWCITGGNSGSFGTASSQAPGTLAVAVT